MDEHLSGVVSPENEAAIRDHISANRDALRRAHHAVVRACRGLLVGDVQVGMDPTVENPAQRWWARVRLNGGRSGREVLVEGHASALAALDALGPRIGATLRYRHGRR